MECQNGSTPCSISRSKGGQILGEGFGGTDWGGRPIWGTGVCVELSV